MTDTLMMPLLHCSGRGRTQEEQIGHARDEGGGEGNKGGPSVGSHKCSRDTRVDPNTADRLPWIC